MLTKFAQAYIEAALWSSVDDDGEPLDADFTIDDLDTATLTKMQLDCADFIEKFSHFFNEVDCFKQTEILGAEVRAGHDFWLTRCGHGAGFWDGDWSEEADKAMSEYSRQKGNVDLVVGDDGMIYAC